MENRQEKKQTITVRNREYAELDGVIEVNGFSDEYLEIETVYGILTIEGEALKITELSQNNGKIYIKGNINALYYKEKRENKGIFGGLFK